MWTMNDLLLHIFYVNHKFVTLDVMEINTKQQYVVQTILTFVS
jgi:hypothetical protein